MNDDDETASTIEDAELASRALYKETRQRHDEPCPFTAIPDNLPRPASYTMDELLRNCEPRQLATWRETWKKHPCVICIPYRPGFDAAKANATARAIATVVARVCGSKLPSVRAAAPAAEPAKFKFRPPWPFLVVLHHQDDADFLTGQFLLSTDLGSYMFLEPEPSTPTFVTTLDGLSTPFPDTDKPVLRASIHDDVKARIDDIRETLDYYADCLDEDFPTGNWVDVLLDSIKVEPLVDGEKVYWNLYAISPFKTADNHEVWKRVLIPSTGIDCGLLNIAYDIDVPFWCSLCLSHEHPAFLCPYPSIPGWRGLTKEEYSELAKNGRSAAAAGDNHHGNAMYNSAPTRGGGPARGGGHMRGGGPMRGGHGGPALHGGWGGRGRGGGRGGRGNHF